MRGRAVEGGKEAEKKRIKEYFTSWMGTSQVIVSVFVSLLQTVV